jgi:ATP-dependent DNA ligase
MLASAYDQKLVDRVEFPAMAQLKLDGMRFNAIVKNGQVEFRSRNGKEINIPNQAFADQFVGLAAFYGDDRVFDGELLVAGPAGPLDRKTGNGILNKAVKGTQSEAEAAQVRATLWDSISLESFQLGVDTEPYQVRLAKLDNCLSAFAYDLVNLAPTTPVADIDEARAIFEQYLAAGQEGIILKTNQGIWENKRSKSLIKFKGELECDLLCVGWEEGTGKNVNRLGALVLESGCGKVRVNVGTGFSDADRVAFTSGNSIGRVVAVKYNARITDKSSDTDSLFLPVFIEFRDDKSVADTDKDIK